jgi:glycosyltransferase involved in cell wall biosynthesis
MRDGGILVLGSAQYSDRSWVNCQQIASRLVVGHGVLFVDSVGLRAPKARRSDMRRIFRRLADAAEGVRTAPDGVRVLSPVTRSGRLLAWSVRSALRATGIAPGAVLAYLPSWAPIVEMFPRARRIYHCVDAYAENPDVDRARIESLERRLLLSVDTVLAASEPLRRRLAPIHPDVRLAPNVADVDRFAAGGPVPEDLAAIPRPWVLYLGNLAGYKVDLPLVAEIARTRPEWSLILVGPAGRGDPATDLSPLARLPNVRLLGERDRALAPAYVAAADVCILPLQEGASTMHSSPIKIWEYLAAGRPVVAAPIPAFSSLIGARLIRSARGIDAWIDAIESSLGEGESGAGARRAEALRHGWADRIREIEALLGGR